MHQCIKLPSASRLSVVKQTYSTVTPPRNHAGKMNYKENIWDKLQVIFEFTTCFLTLLVV